MSDDRDPPPETVEVALAVAVAGGRVLVARRPAGVHLPGVWEFPGGKLAGGETPAAAAQRELGEETGLSAGSLEPLLVLVHPYAAGPVRLHVFLARDVRGDVRIDGAREWGWKTPAELEHLAMPAANGPILRALRSRLP